MSIGMLRIHFANLLDSEEWSIQHPLIYGVTNTNIPDAFSPVAVINSGIYEPLTIDNTDIYDAAFVPATASFVQRMVAFHRGIMYPGAKITKVEINDGRKNTPSLGGATGLTPVFGVQDGLSLPGVMPYSGGNTENTLVGGATAILMSRQSRTPGVANGRFYLRGHLHESDVSIGGKQLLTFTSPLAQAAINTYISTTAATCLITEYFNTDLVELGWRLGIAHYAGGNLLDTYNAGELVEVTPCTGFTVNRLATRQLTRGRKRN